MRWRKPSILLPFSTKHEAHPQGVQWVFKKDRKGRRKGRYMNKPYTGDWLIEQCLHSLCSSCDHSSFPLTHEASVVISISISIAKWKPSSELRSDLLPSSFEWASPHLSLNYSFSHSSSPPTSSAAPAKSCYVWTVFSKHRSVQVSLCLNTHRAINTLLQVSLLFGYQSHSTKSKIPFVTGHRANWGRCHSLFHKIS